MAVVNGIRERIHAPVYDCLRIEAGEQLARNQSAGALRFFMDPQKKTRLETNLQASSLLPHYNTFEARAMRVVLSDLPPEYPDKKDVAEVVLEELEVVDAAGAAAAFHAEASLSLERAMQLLEEARESDEGLAEVDTDPDDEDFEVFDNANPPAPQDPPPADHVIRISTGELQGAIEDLKAAAPAPEQLKARNGASGSIVAKLIYNSVTTLYVGEKVMVEAPTWMFPAGAGPFSEGGTVITHGEPNPLATFRFAEPIFIDKQQNFRVEIEVPHSEILDEVKRIYGPLFIWVVLDGFMTRGVQ